MVTTGLGGSRASRLKDEARLGCMEPLSETGIRHTHRVADYVIPFVLEAAA
jgi:hypothetical protein